MPVSSEKNFQKKLIIFKNWLKTKRAMIFNLLVRKQKGIYGGLYYSNEQWIKKYCEISFGKTKISKSNLLPDDMLIVVQR